MRDTTTPTRVTYRTIYMARNIADRSKDFDSRSLADIWIRNYQVQVTSITSISPADPFEGLGATWAERMGIGR